VKRKGPHQKEVPWVSVRKERALKILAGKHLSFISCPYSHRHGPRGFRGEELLSPGRTAVEPELTPGVCSVSGDPEMLFSPPLLVWQVCCVTSVVPLILRLLIVTLRERSRQMLQHLPHRQVLQFLFPWMKQ